MVVSFYCFRGIESDPVIIYRMVPDGGHPEETRGGEAQPLEILRKFRPSLSSFAEATDDKKLRWTRSFGGQAHSWPSAIGSRPVWLDFLRFTQDKLTIDLRSGFESNCQGLSIKKPHRMVGLHY